MISRGFSLFFWVFPAFPHPFRVFPWGNPMGNPPRTARPWTVSLASVKSFTSGSLAADSWSELLSKGWAENEGLSGALRDLERLGDGNETWTGWTGFNLDRLERLDRVDRLERLEKLNDWLIFVDMC